MNVENHIKEESSNFVPSLNFGGCLLFCHMNQLMNHKTERDGQNAGPMISMAYLQAGNPYLFSCIT